MGLFSRLGTLIRSNINELINKAEDPEKMLNQVLVDMKTQLVEAKKLTPFQATQIWKGKTKQLTVGNYVILEKLGAGGMG